MIAPTPPGNSRWLLETLRAITWHHVVATAVIGLLVGFILLTTSRALFLFWKDNWHQRIYMLKEITGTSQMGAFLFLFCLVGADQAVRRGATRGLAYGTALLIACFLYTTLDWAFRWYVLDWFSKPFIQPWFRKAAPIYTLMSAVLYGGLATFVYVDWRQARASAARLHAATVARTDAARETLRAQLHAMQARVDPQWLFDTLDGVRQFYDSDLERGDRTLDDLILYLRAAMPQLRGRSSTLAGEIELARTYVTIVNDCSAHELRFDVGPSEVAGTAAFPPMLLLPLVQCAFAASGNVSTERNVLGIQARDHADRLEVTIVHGGGAFSASDSDTSLKRVHERLLALFGDAASFEARGLSDGTSQVVMEVPYERA